MNTPITSTTQSSSLAAAYTAHKNCVEFMKRQLSDNTNVFFVLNEIEKMGCKLHRPFFRCTTCLKNPNDPPKISAAYVLGSFDYDEIEKSNEAEQDDDDEDDYEYKHLTNKPGVILCEDVMEKHGRDENVLLHELIHAYDDCRALVNWNSCEQLACAEIRASMLSGECNYMNERRRVNIDTTVVGGYQKCIKRRAGISIKATRACQGKTPEEMINKVFETCYEDIEPFARRP
jgi:hypothetical protein